MSVTSRTPSRMGTMHLPVDHGDGFQLLLHGESLGDTGRVEKGTLLGGNRLNAGHDPHRGKSQAADMAIHMKLPH